MFPPDPRSGETMVVEAGKVEADQNTARATRNPQDGVCRDDPREVGVGGGPIIRSVTA